MGTGARNGAARDAAAEPWPRARAAAAAASAALAARAHQQPAQPAQHERIAPRVAITESAVGEQ